ncbi:hypothetical protein BSL78_10252 [Apostichopus japonicus]|uniref:Uncharacterized protein n=1 Tax=Stichopus japonicus TaxID=307972 RepID=A0A2G8KXU0_STIJA|nr:hypothetical protein BSL78_10252 [Apostichopus japonicus]
MSTTIVEREPGSPPPTPKPVKSRPSSFSIESLVSKDKDDRPERSIPARIRSPCSVGSVSPTRDQAPSRSSSSPQSILNSPNASPTSTPPSFSLPIFSRPDPRTALSSHIFANQLSTSHLLGGGELRNHDNGLIGHSLKDPFPLSMNFLSKGAELMNLSLKHQLETVGQSITLGHRHPHPGLAIPQPLTPSSHHDDHQEILHRSEATRGDSSRQNTRS